MSAPSPVAPPSISSSGHADGLGRRVITFDREDGAMLEALHVRPELGAFEAALRERIDRLATFEDERFARIRGVERDDNSGDLIVVSEFVPGSRLSDLLDVAQEAAQEGITPGVDVALGYLLEALPAMSALHSALGISHGAIAATRTVLTPAGQVVFLDTAFGQVLERLHFSRSRLWVEFGVAMAAGAGGSRFDAAADVAQVALNGVMLVLGRPLRLREYPDALPSIMMEVVEVAQIRGSATFASGIQRFLQRALPLPARRAYGTADEALLDVRQIVRAEMGADTCRRALVEFIAETAANLAVPTSQSPLWERASFDPVAAGFETATDDADKPDEADTLGDGIDISLNEYIAQTEDDEQAIEQELNLDAEKEPSVYDLASGQHELTEQIAADIAHTVSQIHAPAAPALPVEDEPVVVPPAVEAPVLESSAVDVAAPADPVAQERDAPTPAEEELAAPVETSIPGVGWLRRKRQRSARARKDKLRSIAANVPAPAVSPPRSTTSPPIPHDRAAAYDPADDDGPATRAPIGFAPRSTAPPAAPSPLAPVTAAPVAPPSAAPPPLAPPAAPPAPAFAPAAYVPPPPAPAPPVPMPQFATPASYTVPTTSWSPSSAPEPPIASPSLKPAAVTTATPLPVAAPTSPGAPQRVALKLKSDTAGGHGPKPLRIEPRRPDPEPFPQVAYPNHRTRDSDEPRPFPWKLAAAAVIIVACGIVAGRAYLPDRNAADADAASTPAAKIAAARPVTAKTPVTGQTGTLDVTTQPPGAHVLLDGEAAGETPLKLVVPAGRHVLTFVGSSGTMKRNVRVDGGKTVSLDVPLFSGWVAIFAPIVLDVAMNGRSIGSTEDGRLMLPPGRHQLTLSNRDLGYSSTQTVDIDSGEVRSITIEPRGSVNFNAIPWAEVWIDGKKAGDTPLANQQVTLGVREIVFKHPDYGERRVLTTVRADNAAAVSVDFTKR
jgi:hypothetical protein